jgi:hypothetical protein
MTILREHEQIFEEQKVECPPIWVHSALCVTAIVVIVSIFCIVVYP